MVDVEDQPLEITVGPPDPEPEMDPTPSYEQPVEQQPELETKEASLVVLDAAEPDVHVG